MVADNDEVIIKRKSWDKDTHRDDVHTAESLILISCLAGVSFRVLCSKGAYPNGIIEGNKVLNI